MGFVAFFVITLELILAAVSFFFLLGEYWFFLVWAERLVVGSTGSIGLDWIVVKGTLRW
jgi:hypothetical protein